MRAVAIALLVAAPLPAAGQQRLTLQEAAQAALATHPLARAADAQVDAAQAMRAEARAAFQPGVTADASLTRFQEPMVVAPLHGFDPMHPPVFDRTLAQGSLNLTWLAFDGGGRGARITRAGWQREGAEAQRSVARQQVIAEAAQRYGVLLTARELAIAQRARVAALEEERARAERLLEQGRVARVVLLRAEAALSGARAELAAAEARAEVAAHDLARTMGVPADAVLDTDLADVRVSADPPSRTDAVARARSASPELRALSARTESARAAAAEAAGEWWPRLHLGGRYVRYGSGAGDAGGEWQTGVQLSYPIWSGGARPARGERARAEERVARADAALGAQRVEAAIDAALAALAAARARVDAWRAAEAQFAEVARIERLALGTGAGVQTDYLAAESELLRARASLTEARHAELIAHVELARAMGELTLTWIRTNVESQ